MTQPTLKVILNWANEGSTPDLVDLSATTDQTQIKRGRNIIQDVYDVGTASFRVLDPDGKWNPQNTSSIYYGKIVPLRRVNMYATWLGVDYPIFSGFTTTYDYTYPKNEQFGYVTIGCEDAFRLFNMAAVSTVTGGVAGQTTGQRIGSILDQIGWSATDRAIDTGLTVCQADPATVRPALEAIRTVEFTEGLGAFYMSADGKATFKDRQNTIIGYAPRTTRTNYILNPSIEVNTTGWTSFRSTLSQDTTDSVYGSSSVAVVASSTLTGPNVFNTRNATYRVPIVPGQTYTVSAYVKRTVGTRGFRIRSITYSTATSTTAVEAFNGASQNVSGSWIRLSVTATPTNPSSLFAEIVVEMTSAGSVGDTVLVDGFLFEKAPAPVGIYFDGNSSDYPSNYAANTAWTGTADNSVSTVSFLTYPDPVAFGQTPPEIPYQNIVFALDDQLLVNEATFTRVGGTAQTNSNAASITQYFVHSINKPNLLMETDALALDLARAYVAGRQDTEIRIENLSLDLNGVTDSDDMISIIDIDYFDKVLISNQQPGGSTISQTLFVQGLSHDIRPNRWITTIKTYESLLDGLVLNDSVKGTLDYNVLGY